MSLPSKKIDFFTPVYFQNPSLKESVLQGVDDYFSFSGRKAVVIQGTGGNVELKEISQSRVKKYLLGALKVFSYFTIATPLIMLGLKTALRWNKDFHEVKVITQKDIFVFGDVHGELDGFQQNLEHAGLIDPATKEWIGGNAITIQMGDVLDRGPKQVESYEYLGKIQEQAEKAGGKFYRLLGNHELMHLQGNSLMKERIMNDIKSGKLQLAYFDGTRLYLHAGLRSEIRKKIIKEIQKKEGAQAEIGPEKIAEYLNKLLIDAVNKEDYSHVIFQAGKSRGGDEEVGGVVWEDVSEMVRSTNARDIPQVFAHNPPRPGQPPIRLTESMRLINVDAGLCSVYGGHNAYLKISGTTVSIFEKIEGVWEHRQESDKVQKQQKPITSSPLSGASKRDTKKTVGSGQEQGVEPYHRRFPPISLFDTVIMREGKIQSEHGQAIVFADNEILKILPLRVEEKVDGVPLQRTTDTLKTVIQQQATRGCTAAAATMLIVDHKKEPNLKYLQSTNLANEADMARAIKSAGLTPVVQKIPNTLKDIQKAILEDGSAIITIEEPGAHVVVVDKISEDFKEVTLRDPYHGWAIVVSGETFTKALGTLATNDIVQVKSD